MTIRTHLLVALSALAITLGADGRTRPVQRTDVPPPADVFSASEPATVRTLHLDLDLSIDFEAQRMVGSATHTIVNLAGTEELTLDTRDMVIHHVVVDGQPATWQLGAESLLGTPLTIDISPSTRTVTIDYETRSTDGIVWLTALQTIGDQAPFLYTFGEPIRTRDWIPIQDTPGVRMTYDATIRVPPGLMALMSARNPIDVSDDGIYQFEMPYPIPPYLIALAVGRLEFRELGDRTGFYGEPEITDDALHDLRYMPEMLTVAEEIMGPYPFERYDFLLAPPGYSAGGMENPMLNFINVASVVSGDDEEVTVPATLMAHELAHSWAGDSVTCATWGDTWLNEGFATYLSNRILEEMSGPERSEIAFYWDRQSYEGFMEATVRSREQQMLHREFDSGDWPSVFNPTSYRKGSVFLLTLEDSLGRATFDEFLRSWFRRFGMRWADDHSFVGHLTPFITGDAPLEIDQWIYGSGLPDNVTAPQTSVLWDRIEVESNRFRAGVAASRLDTGGWTSFEHGLFLWQITELIPQRIAELDAAFGYSSLKNPSIHWLLAVAQTRYEPGLPMLERYLFLGSWNVISIYDRMAQTPAGKSRALEIYETARPHYVPGIQANVDAILEISSSALRHAA